MIDLLAPPSSGWGSGLVFLLLFSFFPQEKGFCSIMIWSSWFCWGSGACPLSFSLLSFLRTGVLFRHDLLVPPGSGWGSSTCLPFSLLFGSGACLPSSFIFLSSGKRCCSIMICWFLLVSAGVPVLVALFSFFFLSSRVLSHHGLLVPPGSGWGSGVRPPSSLFLGSGACLPSTIFFLSSGKGFCSIKIFWFFLVQAGVPVIVSLLLSSLVLVLVSLLLSSFFPKKRGSVCSVPSWFAGSSWFRLGFWCLSPFFSLLSFLRHVFCSIMVCWFLLVRAGVPMLGSLLLSSLVPVLVSVLLCSFFPQERGSVPSWFPGSFWFFLAEFLVLVSLLLSSFFPQERGSFCSIMICWFLLVPAGVPVLVSFLLSSFFSQERGSVPSWFPGSFWFWQGFRCLSPFFSLLFSGKGFYSIIICWFLLVPAGVPALVSFLLSSFFPGERGSVPSWFAGSVLVSLILSSLVLVLVSLLLSSFFPQERGSFCSIMICWFLLVPARVSVLVSLLLSSFFPQERGSVPSWFAGSSWFRLGFRVLSPFFSLLWFRCLSPFFSLFGSVPSWFASLSWFRLGFPCFSPLFSLLWLRCLSPFLVFFLSSGKGFCFIMTFCSFWFRLGFRCLSPFCSLTSFFRKGVLFLHDLLVPPGSGCGSGACLPSSFFFLSSGKKFCSIMICWFLLVPAGVPVLVSLLLSSLVSVLVALLLPFWF